jgi:hypothetical protein
MVWIGGIGGEGLGDGEEGEYKRVVDSGYFFLLAGYDGGVECEVAY